MTHACIVCTECVRCSLHICPELEDCAPFANDWYCGPCLPEDDDGQAIRDAWAEEWVQ